MPRGLVHRSDRHHSVYPDRQGVCYISTNMIRGKQPMRGQGVIRQALRREVPLFLGYPFLQAAMGVNDECGHGTILLRHLDALPRRTPGIPSPTACTTFVGDPNALDVA